MAEMEAAVEKQETSTDTGVQENNDAVDTSKKKIEEQQGAVEEKPATDKDPEAPKAKGSEEAGAADAAKEANEAKPDATDTKPDDAEDNAPITDWNNVSIKFPKDFKVNKESYDSFGEAAVKAGLTQKQAQALVDWQIQEVNAYQKAMQEVGTEELQKAWGAKYEENKKAAVGFVQRIDRLMGDNEFSKALSSSGAAMHPGIVKALYKMSEVISEDSIGMNSGTGADETETALQGIMNRLNEQRKGRVK